MPALLWGKNCLPKSSLILKESELLFALIMPEVAKCAPNIDQWGEQTKEDVVP